MGSQAESLKPVESRPVQRFSLGDVVKFDEKFRGIFLGLLHPRGFSIGKPIGNWENQENQRKMVMVSCYIAIEAMGIEMVS